MGRLRDRRGALRTGTSVIPTTPPGARVLPRALASGLACREFTQFWDDTRPVPGPGIFFDLVTAGVGGAVVMRAPWMELEPNGPALDPIALALLKSRLDKANEHGLKVMLRSPAGFEAPQWVKTEVGSLQWADNEAPPPEWELAGTKTDPVTGVVTTYRYLPGGIPMFWRPAFWTRWDGYMQRLAAAIGNHPALAEVVSVGATTRFAEPCIMQASWAPNIDQLFDPALNTGFTDAARLATFVEGWKSHMRWWAPYRIASYTPYNPIEYTKPVVSPDFPHGSKLVSGDVTTAIWLMEQHMAICGGLTVLGNNSLTYPETNGKYVQMYERIWAARLAVPATTIGFQTETFAKITADPGATVQGTVDWGVQQGSMRIELPVGAQSPQTDPANTITPTEAASYNAQLKANAVGLWAA